MIDFDKYEKKKNSLKKFFHSKIHVDGHENVKYVIEQ